MNFIRNILMTFSRYRISKFTFSDSSLKSLGQNCVSLRKAVFYSCPVISDRGLLELSRGCHKLDEINLAWCSKVTDQGKMGANHQGILPT